MTRWSGRITRAATMRPCYELVFAKSHESEIGTFRTWRDVRPESAFGGKAENIYSERVFRLLTLNGPRLQPLPHGCRSRCEAQQNRWAWSGAPRLRLPGLFAWYPRRRRR